MHWTLYISANLWHKDMRMRFTLYLCMCYIPHYVTTCKKSLIQLKIQYTCLVQGLNWIVASGIGQKLRPIQGLSWKSKNGLDSLCRPMACFDPCFDLGSYWISRFIRV